MGQWVGLGQVINKEASWLYAELKSHILFQVSFVAYLKLSDETWNEMCYLKLLKLFELDLLIWNCQMKLEKEVLFETFETWNFSSPSWGVAYLKLSDETWKRGAIWNFWNLKLFKPLMRGCLFETFRWDLKWDVLLELLILETFQTHQRSWLFETFRWDLKWDVLFEIFETFQLFQTHHESCLFETFRWDLNKKCYLRLLKLFNLFKPIMRAAYLKLSDET